MKRFPINFSCNFQQKLKSDRTPDNVAKNNQIICVKCQKKGNVERPKIKPRENDNQRRKMRTHTKRKKEINPKSK